MTTFKRTLLAVSAVALAFMAFVAPAGAQDETPTTQSTTSTTEVPDGPLATVNIGATDSIMVNVTPEQVEGPCASPAIAHASMEQVGVSPNEHEFIVKFRSYHDACEPFLIRAAVYDMPGFGESWPQALNQFVEFDASQAGEYEVIFNKVTAPCAQYDVIVGETPEVIHPLGEWHGPMLFPFDTATAFQNWDGCPEAAPAPAPAPEAPVQIDAPAELAFTGVGHVIVVILGILLILSGLFLLLLGLGYGSERD